MRDYYSFSTEYGAADKFFQAVLSLDKDRVEQLKANGQTLTENVKNTLVNGGGSMVSNKPASPFWYLYLTDLESVGKEDFAWISHTFFEETGAPLYFSDSLEHVIAKYFFNIAVFTALLECYDLKKLNKTRVLKELTRKNNVPVLELCAAHGWLKQAKKRDELIEYANAQKATEATAWLLDFKNRTADLPAERVKAEKKAEREINAAPDSALELSKLWSWKKQEDGTLIITSYKGEQTEVTVPAKIGKDSVTAIGEYALSPRAPKLRSPYNSRREKITKITVPNGIKTIGECAFGGSGINSQWHRVSSKLEEVTLPETLDIFNDMGAAENAPKIVGELDTVATIPNTDIARFYCIKNNILYRYADDDTVHIPYKEVIAGDALFSAILDGDEEKVRKLKKGGAVLAEHIKEALLHERDHIDVSYNIQKELFSLIFEKETANRDFILKTLREETGEPLYFRKYDLTHKFSPELFDCILKYYDTKFINRIQEMQYCIKNDHIGHLAVYAEHGWLKLPATRDKMIQYASDNNKTEILAWLLDFKNRTADLAAERKRAEKKAERELNADPNSPTALKKMWGFKKQEDGTLIITSYKGTRTDIIVPSTIGKDAVTAIGELAFSPNASGLKREQAEFRQTISRIKLPDSIKSIGAGAFRFCEALSEINIPDSVAEIGDEAFIYCSGLTEIIIPETVKKIGNSMFAGCTGLCSVKLPESTAEIGDNMFSNCRSLKSITLPDSIRRIGDRAFSSCMGLTKLDIPDGVAGIGRQAFSYCSGLTELVVPDTVTEIGNGAFEWCTELRSVTLPESISEIGNYTFTRCDALQSIKLPAAVQSIKMGAFSGCHSLREIVVPEGVTEIGHDAFADCGELKTVVIPATVNVIVNAGDNTVFNGSNSVTVIAEPGSFAEAYCKNNNISFKNKM